MHSVCKATNLQAIHRQLASNTGHSPSSLNLVKSSVHRVFTHLKIVNTDPVRAKKNTRMDSIPPCRQHTPAMPSSSTRTMLILASLFSLLFSLFCWRAECFASFVRSLSASFMFLVCHGVQLITDSQSTSPFFGRRGYCAVESGAVSIPGGGVLSSRRIQWGY